MIYLKAPNLPVNPALVLVGEEYFEELYVPLSKFGIKSIAVPKNPFVDARIASHCDLSVLHLDKNTLLLSPHLKDSEFENRLRGFGFNLLFSDSEFSSLYPKDSHLNLYISDNFAVFNPESADKSAIDWLKLSDKKLINCRQGYTKCMICPVDSNSIISCDPSISKVCAEQGIDVLKIQQGFVDLNGYEYGFIGGACFKISSSCVAFTGKLDLHPDKDIILSFLNKRGIEAVYLTDRNVFDVGSIVPIMEKPR